MPVTYLLFTTRGRISRSEYAHAAVLIACAFYVLYTALFNIAGPWSTWVLYPLLYWSVSGQGWTINDVTQLNPVTVARFEEFSARMAEIRKPGKSPFGQ